MSFFAGRYFFLQILAVLASVPAFNRVYAEPLEPEVVDEPRGSVWFIGTVERVDDGVATIDLGEVHTLRSGSRVAAVRYRDGQFSPLGVLEVQYSHPVWCDMSPSETFTSEVGDYVMFVEAPGDLGSGDAIRDTFLRHQIVTNANRNRYSTTRDFIEADSLQRMIEKQRHWIKGNRRVAGIVRSPAVTSPALDRLKLFMNQIMLFQDYKDKGVNVAQVIPASWSELLKELRPDHSMTTENAAFEVADVNPVEPVASETNDSSDRSLEVRRQVDESMFQWSPEERNLVAAVCTALLTEKTADERQWMTHQLAGSQFPFLSRREQILLDMEAVMRKVRRTE